MGEGTGDSRIERDENRRAAAGARKSTRDCLGISARSHARRACAGLRSPYTQVIGDPSPPSTSLSGTAGLARASGVARPRRSFESWFLLSYGPAPSRRSPLSRARARVSLSLYLSRFLSESRSPPSLPFAPLALRSSLWCLSLPPDIRIDSSATRSGPVRRSFSPPRFFLRMPRPRTIFISTTCLAGRRGTAHRFTVRRLAWRWGPTFISSPRFSYSPLFFRLLRATNAVLMIIVARLIVATVLSPMRDDIGSEWMHTAATRPATLWLTISSLRW